MPPLPAIGPLQLLSASGSASTVRPSGARGIRCKLRGRRQSQNLRFARGSTTPAPKRNAS